MAFNARSLLVGVVAACVVGAAVAVPSPAQAQPGGPAPSAPDSQSIMSSPPDRTILHGQPGSRSLRPLVSTSGVFVNDATAAASSSGGNEPAIAVNPANPDQIVITRFNASWPGNADLLYSTDGGITWTNEATIPVPPGLAASVTTGCPCDQTVDYGRDGTLYGTFLTSNNQSVVSGSTTDPTKASSWSWNGNPAQLTSGTRTPVDQPWLLVNRDPTTASQDNVYVGYDDFGGSPDARVGVSLGASPVNITVDNKAGTESPSTTNPGLRLATDPRNGTVYALYEQSSGSTQPKNVTYKLNRSTDAGATWTLNGSTDGLTVDSVTSDQAPGFKFGGVNALLGGVDHAAVDPSNGDVYVAYGQDVSGGNQIMIRRMTDNGTGGLNVGAASAVSTSTNTALPSVAVLTDGTVGVLYDSFDGNTMAGFPTFSAHLARSTDHGVTFTDTVLQTFQSPSTNNGNGRQRVLGDFHQLKAVGTTFYGTFAGNNSGVPATNPPIDAMFFSVPQRTQTSLASSANPSVFGQPVSFTATVRPVPDGGTVSFSVDGNPLGGPVPVNTTTGQAVSASISNLSPGTHSVNATYSGDANFAGSTAPTLTQVVNRAPVTTTLTSAPNPSLFGHAVTFSDTVCPAGASTNAPTAPSGTVTVADGPGVLGIPTLTPGGGPACSRVSVNASNLLPGTHDITATYGGDANFLPAAAEHLTQTVTCKKTITGRVNGSIIATGESVCIINATVNGSVLVRSGTALFIGNSTISGSVEVTNPTLVGVCGSTVTGSVRVVGASRFVVIGDPGDDGCAPNDITGSLLLTQNRGGLEAAGNTIGGSVQVDGTHGVGPFPEDSRAEIEGNTINGSLHCSGNVPPPTNDGQPNTVTGSRGDQCSTL